MATFVHKPAAATLSNTKKRDPKGDGGPRGGAHKQVDARSVHESKLGEAVHNMRDGGVKHPLLDQLESQLFVVHQEGVGGHGGVLTGAGGECLESLLGPIRPLVKLIECLGAIGANHVADNLSSRMPNFPASHREKISGQFLLGGGKKKVVWPNHSSNPPRRWEFLLREIQ